MSGQTKLRHGQNKVHMVSEYETTSNMGFRYPNVMPESRYKKYRSGRSESEMRPILTQCC